MRCGFYSAVKVNRTQFHSKTSSVNVVYVCVCVCFCHGIHMNLAKLGFYPAEWTIPAKLNEFHVNFCLMNSRIHEIKYNHC